MSSEVVGAEQQFGVGASAEGFRLVAESTCKSHARAGIKPGFRLIVDVDTRILASKILVLKQDFFVCWECVVARAVSELLSGESEADSRLDFGTGCIEAELERSPSAVDVDFGGLTVDAALPDLVDSAVEETPKFEWDLISVKCHFDWPPPVGVARDASCWWRDSHLFHKEVKAADVWESLLESVGFDVGGGTDREITSHEKPNPSRVGGC